MQNETALFGKRTGYKQINQMRERNLVGFTPTKNVQFRCPIKEFRSNVISLVLSEPYYVILLRRVERIECCFWSLQNNTVGPPSQQTNNTGLKSKRENGKQTVRYRGIKQIQTVHFIFEIMKIRNYHILSCVWSHISLSSTLDLLH